MLMYFVVDNVTRLRIRNLEKYKTDFDLDSASILTGFHLADTPIGVFKDSPRPQQADPAKKDFTRPPSWGQAKPIPQLEFLVVPSFGSVVPIAFEIHSLVVSRAAEYHSSLY